MSQEILTLEKEKLQVQKKILMELKEANSLRRQLLHQSSTLLAGPINGNSNQQFSYLNLLNDSVEIVKIR